MSKQKIEIDVRTPPADGERKQRHASVSGSPFFAGIGEEGEDVLDHIVIYRDKPIREGQLGTLAADASEDDVREQFGGGSFRLIGRTDRKKPISGAFTTIDLAGDPIFTNEVSRKRWEKIKRAELGDDAKAPIHQGDADEAKHLRELARIKAEADRELARLRLELTAKEEAEERRRTREREERAAEREAEREARREEREAEAEARREERRERLEHEARERAADREMRRAELEGKGDPVAQLAAIAQIAGMLGAGGRGGGPEDAVTAFMDKLPDTIREVRETGIAIKASDDEDALTFKGPIADVTKAAIANLRKQGKDPEKILTGAMAAIAQAKAVPAKKQIPAKPKK